MARTTTEDCCREWTVRTLGGIEPKIAYVQDAITIAMGLSTGGYVRIESEFMMMELMQVSDLPNRCRDQDSNFCIVSQSNGEQNTG